MTQWSRVRRPGPRDAPICRHVALTDEQAANLALQCNLKDDLSLMLERFLKHACSFGARVGRVVIDHLVMAIVAVIVAMAAASLAWAKSPVTVPVGVLLALGLVAVAAGACCLCAHMPEVFKPYMRAYRHDTFGRILWRWRYTWRGVPRDIRAYCPTDDMELACLNAYETDGGDEFECEKCRARFSGHETDTDWVRREIELKIRNGTWIRQE